MSFSVGVLYSAVDFLTLLDRAPISVRDFRASFERFSVANANEVLKVSQECCWIELNVDGYIYATEHGKRLLGHTDYKLPLRMQICDLIAVYQPSWAKRMRNGRAEVAKYLADDVSQCFRDAGLLGTWAPDIISWWDELAQTANARSSAELLAIGRKAEQLTIEHEEYRTGCKPKWQALESNFSGYDVLSRLSGADGARLMIEVKGTTQKKRDAYFYLTKNEWIVAEQAENYQFHLWLLSYEPAILIKVDKDLVKRHMPENQGKGTWENVRIPFDVF